MQVASAGSHTFPRPSPPAAVATYSPWEPIFADSFEGMPEQFRNQFLRAPEEAFVPVMSGTVRVWHRPHWLGPVFRRLAREGILVASEGEHVAMTLTMVPRRAADGRPYNLCARTFEFGPPAHFDTVKLWDARLSRLVEYVGRSRRLFVVWRTTQAAPGLISFETERIALVVRTRRFWLPDWFWRACIGVTRFVQAANPDGRTIDIRFRLTQSLLGDVFGYEGTFAVVRAETTGGSEA